MKFRCTKFDNIGQNRWTERWDECNHAYCWLDDKNVVVTFNEEYVTRENPQRQKYCGLLDTVSVAHTKCVLLII